MLCKLFALREAALAPSRRRLTMTEHILQAYRIDIETRTNSEGDQRRNPEGWKVNAHEIKSGVIYKDAKVTVRAFTTKHGAAGLLPRPVAGRFLGHARCECRRVEIP